ncbi:transcriptional regulator, TetR family [Pseudonocardia ammonioxydans]|uniref:Transcriptional regulator, TetR family n=1 Tax=Pseudonocardia ammonioxydans TaxID=260086 RepID=A0A1I4WY58_PSUAM|nr:TetR/AcrR family transcriptional regulator [Pseudonocardia ammonioxydans]SFN18143.1 transcriptional regulator, TetR family [Pseudonocardia ammonioxydans]
MTTHDRRTAILDAALACFVESGLAGASIEDVRGRSGASVGSIYHHFGGREGLAGAVYVRALAGYQDVFTAAVTTHDDAEAGVRAAVAAHLRWCLSDRPDAARFLLFCGDAARAAAADRLGEQNRAFFRTVVGWWRRRVADGALQDLPVTVLYALWLGPAQEYCRLELAGRSTTDPDVAAAALAEGAWRALRRG